MIIGIDASRSLHSRPTGVERYSTEIIRSLLKDPSLKRHEFRLYTPAPLPTFPARFQRVIPFRRLWTLIRLSLEMLLHRPDILFVPAYGLPLFAPRRSFVTIHDIAFEKFPEVYRPLQRWILRWTTRRALRWAEAVFVPSQAVADDVQKFYSNIQAKIVVIPHGPLHLAPSGESPIEGDYLLFVGRLEAKKNVMRLVDAWRAVRTQYPDLQLVLAGRASAEWKPVKGVVELGFCDEATLHALLKNARALVLPSLDEGFGFPILQAFEAACPVLCSDIPALREVGGDAVLSFDPLSAQSIRETILKLMAEEELASVLVAKGRRRLQDFSWAQAAQTIASVFLENPVHSDS